MSPRLQNKRCLIVGGTSGLGLAAAKRFLEEGARLVLGGLDDGFLVSARDHLTPLGLIHIQPCDASDPASVEMLMAATADRLGGLDVLYHVAGASGRRHGDGALHQCTDQGWQLTLGV